MGGRDGSFGRLRAGESDVGVAEPENLRAVVRSIVDSKDCIQLLPYQSVFSLR